MYIACFGLRSIECIQKYFNKQKQSKYSMIVNELKQVEEACSQERHSCEHCKESEAILAKYKQLVNLLYKKIRQLQKKSGLQLQANTLIKRSHIQYQQQATLTEEVENATKCIDRVIYCRSQEKLPPEATTKESFRGQAPSRFGRRGVSEMDEFQRVGIVINGLTEQVMQLKSNFMHIRHCVYAFVRELNLGERIKINYTALNITLALISIFQFSENQKEEMFDHKKVKMRKRLKGENKENVFVTIREL